MILKNCSEHGFYKGKACNKCLENIKKEYENKLTKEERIKIENNWKYVMI